VLRREFIIGIILISAVPAKSLDRVIVTDEEFQHITGHLPKNRNPHSGYEYQLMTQGSKKLAFIGEHQIDPFRKDAKFMLERFENVWLAYKVNDDSYAIAFKDVYTKFHNGTINTSQADRLCGELLGYTDKQINSFVGRSDGIR